MVPRRKSVPKVKRGGKRRKLRRKAPSIVSIILVVGLLYALWYFWGGVVRYYRVWLRNREVQTQIVLLEAKRAWLLWRLEKLKEDEEWERLARERLGMRRKGERVIFFTAQ